MSLPYTTFHRSQSREGRYTIIGSLSFTCTYLNNRKVEFSGKAANYNLKKAMAIVARDILSQVYQVVPELWKDYVERKNRKGLVA